MIRSYKSKALRRFAERGDASKLPIQNVDKVRRILAALERARHPGDMDQPGWRYHPIKHWGGRHAVMVSGNWRLTWSWENGEAVDVDLEDYH